jgi:hypothetical protein
MSKKAFYEYYRLYKSLYIWVNQECVKLSYKQFEALGNITFKVDGHWSDFNLTGDKVIKL